MRVWPILNLLRMTSSRLELLMEVDQGLGVFFISSSLLERWFFQKVYQAFRMRER